jgi:hypothetical protein
MLKCGFCEQALACTHCGKPFRPRQQETHLAVYQPDMEIFCPECQHQLVCKACGLIYGGTEDEDEA